MIYKNIVCPVCGGAACDDIQVEFGDGKIEARNACKMGERQVPGSCKFSQAQAAPPYKS